jgi:hypothetical protein
MRTCPHGSTCRSISSHDVGGEEIEDAEGAEGAEPSGQLDQQGGQRQWHQSAPESGQ